MNDIDLFVAGATVMFLAYAGGYIALRARLGHGAPEEVAPGTERPSEVVPAAKSEQRRSA